MTIRARDTLRALAVLLLATSTGLAPAAVPVPDKPTVSAACLVMGIEITPETGPAPMPKPTLELVKAAGRR